MKGKKNFNQLNREYEDKEVDPRGETEEEYLAWRADEDRKIEEWEEKRRGSHE